MAGFHISKKNHLSTVITSVFTHEADKHSKNALTADTFTCSELEFLPDVGHSPHAVSCKGHRRCTPAPPLRFSSTGWWWWCDSWCRTGPPSWRQTEAEAKRVSLQSYSRIAFWGFFVIAYQASLRFDKRSVDAVHLVVQSAGVAQVVACAVSPPEGGRHGPAVHALTSFREVIE